MDFKSIDIDYSMFRRSSAVEQLTVNQLVVGSIPTAGAKIPNSIKPSEQRVDMLGYSIGPQGAATIRIAV